METLLRRWWTNKYKLPWTHECAQSATLEDLLVEYYEDFYEKNPSEARKVFSEDGEFFFESTGDPLLDKWEEELQKGLIPDLEEGMSAKDKDKLREERASVRRARGAADELFKEPDEKRLREYQSKFASPGTKREQDLLQQQARYGMLGETGPTDDEGWEDMLMGMSD